MIKDLSLTLKEILDDRTLPDPLKSASKVFDRPDESFIPDQTTINLFLYDIRENVELRSNETRFERLNAHVIAHRPPLRISCSYLITAWPVSGDRLPEEELPLEEQHLLSQILEVLSKYPTIPKRFLQGSLKPPEPPLPQGSIWWEDPPLPMVTLHPDALKNLSEFWTSLGSRIRPSITVTATISMPVFADVTGPIVTTKITGIDLGKGRIEESMVQIGGQVITIGEGGRKLGIPGVLVDILNAGVHTTTDSEGRYSFSRVPAGTHTIRAVVVGFEPKTQPLVVPGRPEDYDITLTPL
ncbi:MAG TPA: Pvc16 family protein [candidate division Zixibacteria bacterium]|nr:Pvc16 family protein [candidate division Zixibacteria bacterium]